MNPVVVRSTVPPSDLRSAGSLLGRQRVVGVGGAERDHHARVELEDRSVDHGGRLPPLLEELHEPVGIAAPPCSSYNDGAARSRGSLRTPLEEIVAISHPAGSSVVWIVNQYAGSPRHGMEYRHYYLARGLTQRGHRWSSCRAAARICSRAPPEVSRPFTLEEHRRRDVLLGRGTARTSVRSASGASLNMAAFALRLERLPIASAAARPTRSWCRRPRCSRCRSLPAGRGDSARGWSSRCATSGR